MSLEAQNHVNNNISSDKIQIKDKVPLIKEELDINSFIIPESRKPYLKSVLVPEGGADSRIEKLAQNIAEFYQDRKFICLILLRGGAMVYGKLQKYLTNLFNYGKYQNVVQGEFLKCSSYKGNKSTGKLEIGDFDFSKLNGKEVLLVEDIIDTGLTLKSLQEMIKEKSKIKDLKTCCLARIQKEKQNIHQPQIDFLGFELPNNFYVGYCFEINDHFRDVKHICALNDEGIEKYKDNQYFD